MVNFDFLFPSDGTALGCRESLKELHQLSFNALFFEGFPFGISNNIMAFSPNHPLMIHATNRLLSHNGLYLTSAQAISFSTGSTFLSACIYDFGKKINRHHVSKEISSLNESMIISKIEKKSLRGQIPANHFD